jgi:rhodanese-related sulfurtransferase
VCDPTGVAQVYEGTADSERLTLEVATTAVSRTSSAKEVTQLRRTYCVHSPKEGSCLTPVRLSYVVEMAAVGQPMQQHLVGELEKEVQDISAAAVRKELLSHEFALVDVREREEFASGHVEGAINLPLGHLLHMAGNDLPRLMELLPQQRVVIYCNQGYRSVLARQELLALGVPRTIFSLQGGWEGWNALASSLDG